MQLRLLRMDPLLAAATVALLAMGVLLVGSAVADRTAGVTLREGPALRQLVVAGVGLLAMLGASRLDYRLLQRHAGPIYLVAAGALVLVFVLGQEQFGSRRWLAVGPASVQPSEFAKLAIAVALAALLAARPRGSALAAASLAVVGGPVLLVLVEPDTGTALVMLLAWLALVVTWGAPWRALGALLAAGAGVVPLVVAVAMPAYQRERLAVFLDPSRDPLGSGFNVKQAEIAIGSGGLTGDGILQAGDSALTHVAARSSDFIFAQAGEDLGLLGAAGLLLLLGLLVWRGFEAARHAPDEFGQLLAVALTSTVLAQALVHAAVNLRLFPATGITLPLVSAGGSSVVVVCVAVGLLMSIAAHRPATAREQWTAERWH